MRNECTAWPNSWKRVSTSQWFNIGGRFPSGLVKLQTKATTWTHQICKVTNQSLCIAFYTTSSEKTFSISKPSRGLKQARSVGHLSHKLLFDFQNHRTWAEHNFGRHISHHACNSVESVGWTRPSQTSTTRLVPIYKYWRYISCTYPHYISFITTVQQKQYQ